MVIWIIFSFLVYKLKSFYRFLSQQLFHFFRPHFLFFFPPSRSLYLPLSLSNLPLSLSLSKYFKLLQTSNYLTLSFGAQSTHLRCSWKVCDERDILRGRASLKPSKLFEKWPQRFSLMGVLVRPFLGRFWRNEQCHCAREGRSV